MQNIDRLNRRTRIYLRRQNKLRVMEMKKRRLRLGVMYHKAKDLFTLDQ